MGATKFDIHKDIHNHIASFAKALAHPARIAIIRIILNQKDCIGDDLVQEIGLSQPTISQHMKELKMAGIIKGNVEGNKVCYNIDPEGWSEMKTSFDLFLLQIPDLERLNC